MRLRFSITFFPLLVSAQNCIPSDVILIPAGGDFNVSVPEPDCYAAELQYSNHEHTYIQIQRARYCNTTFSNFTLSLGRETPVGKLNFTIFCRGVAPQCFTLDVDAPNNQSRHIGGGQPTMKNRCDGDMQSNMTRAGTPSQPIGATGEPQSQIPAPVPSSALAVITPSSAVSTSPNQASSQAAVAPTDTVSTSPNQASSQAVITPSSAVSTSPDQASSQAAVVSDPNQPSAQVANSEAIPPLTISSNADSSYQQSAPSSSPSAAMTCACTEQA